MLQNNSVQNLQYDSDLRISQPQRVNPVVFSSQNSIITSEPGGRRVSVIDVSPTSPGASNSTLSSYLPNSGLSILEDLPSVHIHQTYELNEMLTSVSSENRFTVRAPQNEAIFAASEGSTKNNRLVWGSNRPFTMHLLDKHQQEILTLRRKFGCRCFCFPFALQRIEVWSPPGVLLGSIREEFKFFEREFQIFNQEGQFINTITVPFQAACCVDKESFRILSSDQNRQDATITRIWNTDINTYTMNIYFTDVNLNVQAKSLYLAAGFLFDYLFFQ